MSKCGAIMLEAVSLTCHTLRDPTCQISQLNLTGEEGGLSSNVCIAHFRANDRHNRISLKTTLSVWLQPQQMHTIPHKHKLPLNNVTGNKPH